MSAAASAVSSPLSDVGSAATKLVNRARRRDQTKRVRIDSMVKSRGREGS